MKGFCFTRARKQHCQHCLGEDKSTQPGGAGLDRNLSLHFFEGHPHWLATKVMAPRPDARSNLPPRAFRSSSCRLPAAGGRGRRAARAGRREAGAHALNVSL